MQHKAINGIGPAGKGARELATERAILRESERALIRRALLSGDFSVALRRPH